MSRARRPVLAGITAVVLLGLGAGVAVVLDDALGISSQASNIPVETSTPAAAQPTALPPEFTAIDAPASTRMDAAVAELRDAASSAAGTDGAATLTVALADAPSVVVDTNDDSYDLGGTADALTVTAATEAGAVRGVYDLAAAIRDGRPVTDKLGQTVTSALPFRMVDLGAVGVTADPAEWIAGDNYSHNSGAFEDVFLAEAPYIDADALATAQDDFEQYARHVVAEGYTAIAFPGLIEYLTFSGADGGAGVYNNTTDHLARAAAMLAAFQPMWRYADDLGLDVFLRTDMLTLTTPLQNYFDANGYTTDDPELWQTYADAIDDLYAAAPELDGVLIRIGEAGRVYDLPGWDYYSELAVTTTSSVRAMLTALSAEAETAGKEVIFRSWSVGVGAVGDMHTDPDSYAAVLDGLDSPALIVSTKYTLGDFYSHLPVNVTLESGDQRRIIEFQSRREFESFGAFPNDLGSLYSTAIQTFVAANPHVEGIWTWTQDGGPWRAGPMSLELKSGFWQLYELNTELAVRLARDPSEDPAAITADWARRWFSDDPATVAAISTAMASSRAAITDGLYIGPYADKQVAAIGLHPPPMMWIFEWDIVTGDSAVLDVIYQVSRSELSDAIEGGHRAIAAVDAMQTSLQATDPASWKSADLRDEFFTSLASERSTLTVLGAYREMILRQGEWHDTGSPDAYAAWSAALASYRSAATEHVGMWRGDVQHPALNLTAASLGVARAERDLPMAWAARVLLALLFLAVALRPVRVLLRAAVTPWNAARLVSELSRRERIVLVAVPVVALVASRGILTWFEAPAHLLVTLAGWLIFSVVVLLAPRWVGRGHRGRPETLWAIAATLGGVALLRIILLMVVIAPTGPGGYWFHFWTDPTGRAVYVTLAFALFGWLFVAPAWALAGSIGARRAAGTVVAGVGLVLALVGGFIAAVGLETSLTVWNDQLGLLPWGLSRILGITTYLEIPQSSALFAAIAGVVLAVVGSMLVLVRLRRRG